jgi:hypothetical protein
MFRPHPAILGQHAALLKYLVLLADGERVACNLLAGRRRGRALPWFAPLDGSEGFSPLIPLTPYCLEHSHLLLSVRRALGGLRRMNWHRLASTWFVVAQMTRVGLS